ncbi:helix-turn-helix domain-containing protein [uncultured Trichococcus sp.]|uniref:helix-turn-helix domain-containing protein n=1 Tax=uncultured Trichococcus sp. TaxID=189665 RepID=UPI00374874F9
MRSDSLPNQEQQILIGKTIGCFRLVFNRFLSEWKKTYEGTGSGGFFSFLIRISVAKFPSNLSF